MRDGAHLTLSFPSIHRVIAGAGDPFNPDLPRSNRRTEIGAFSIGRASGDGLASAQAFPWQSVQGHSTPCLRPGIAHPANR
ncbi:hypothetical protein EMIT0196MI5_50291 [Pseudomonas sp. IT-196MI5]